MIVRLKRPLKRPTREQLRELLLETLRLTAQDVAKADASHGPFQNHDTALETTGKPKPVTQERPPWGRRISYLIH